MPRRNRNQPLNTTGLEADVMRFMAIIAFCLIAMMALVKKSGSEADLNIGTDDVLPPVAIVHKPDATNPDDMPRQVTPKDVIVKTARPTDISLRIKDQVTMASSPASEVEAPVKVEASVKVEFPQDADPVQTTVPEKLAVESVYDITRDTANTTSEESATLTFRFDSDRTFLHLIATSQLSLYANTTDGFLAMDAAFNIRQAQPAGELYEVMPNSIPRKITHIFEKSSQAPVYLVALPTATTKDLGKFLTNASSQHTGALVIDRDGHISHEI